MAWTNWGFDGTINEAQWSQMAGLLGNGYVAAGNGDCLVTAVGGARSVSVAEGTLYGDGIVSVNSAPETVAMTTPVNGQWYVIALRRTWASNTAALVAIAGATTTTTTPTAAPSTFPTLNTSPGVLTDQPIAWAWCNSANTTVVVFDIRLKAVKSLPPVVATAAERDAKFMAPTQGLQVWRNDLGLVETYYGLYNASTNPGGRDSAGWYTDTRAMGLVPVRPTTATIASGTGSANSMGVVSFTGATSVSLDGVFTSKYANYFIMWNLITTADSVPRVRLRASGVDTTSGYTAGRLYQIDGSVGGQNNGTGGDWGLTPTGVQKFEGNMTLYKPNEAANTHGHHSSFMMSSNSSGTQIAQQHGTQGFFSATQFDGFTIYGSAGTASGTIQVFGYND
jgi:hypothetical protein